MSILQVGAAVHNKYDYVFVDGNLEIDPLNKILDLFKTGEYKYFCSTVMPGPQLRQGPTPPGEEAVLEVRQAWPHQRRVSWRSTTDSRRRQRGKPAQRAHAELLPRRERAGRGVRADRAVHSGG